MHQFKQIAALLAVSSVLLALLIVPDVAEARQQEEPGNSLQPRRSSRSRDRLAKLGEEERLQNEINSDRIQVAEPYRSLIQLTTRQVLTQANISKHLDVDVAMTLINEASFALSKPATLIRAVEAVLLVVATLLGATFFFPNAHKHLEVVWREPSKALYYMPNEKNLHQLLEASVEGFLGKIGLKEEACRFQAVCYCGEKLHSLRVPNLPPVAVKFINGHKIVHSLKNHKYVQAFLAGYEDLDCAELNALANNKSCLVNLMESSLNQVRQFAAQVAGFKLKI